MYIPIRGLLALPSVLAYLYLPKPRPLPLYGDRIMPIVSSILRILGPGRDTSEPSSNACVAIRYVQMVSKYLPKCGCNWILQQASASSDPAQRPPDTWPDDDRHSSANWAHVTMNVICNFRPSRVLGDVAR